MNFKDDIAIEQYIAISSKRPVFPQFNVISCMNTTMQNTVCLKIMNNFQVLQKRDFFVSMSIKYMYMQKNMKNFNLFLLWFYLIVRLIKHFLTRSVRNTYFINLLQNDDHVLQRLLWYCQKINIVECYMMLKKLYIGKDSTNTRGQYCGII